MAPLHRPPVQTSSVYSRMSCGSAASMSLVTQMCSRVTGSAREGAHCSQEGVQTGLVSPGTRCPRPGPSSSPLEACCSASQCGGWGEVSTHKGRRSSCPAREHARLGAFKDPRCNFSHLGSLRETGVPSWMELAGPPSEVGRVTGGPWSGSCVSNPSPPTPCDSDAVTCELPGLNHPSL